MKKFLESGKIVNTHGTRGEVKITPWADSPEFLAGFSRVFINGKAVEIESARIHKGAIIAKFRGVDDIADAMGLKDTVVFIDRADAALPEGDFFIQDIIGALVVSEDGERLGDLFDVLELPAGNVYVVRGDREILIPAIPEFIVKTDPAAGVVTVRLIEGM